LTHPTYDDVLGRDVLRADKPSIASSGLAGSLPDLPDIGWDDFERASDLARQDLAPT